MTLPEAMPHGPILEIGNDVFWVRGSVKMAPGLTIGRNMVIVRSGRDLTLVSAIRLSEAGERELMKLGDVRHVVRIGVHKMDDVYSVNRFQAEYWTVAGMTVPAELSNHRQLAPAALPIADATLFLFEDTVAPEAALLVQRSPGILITCDSVQNWPDASGCSAAGKLIARFMGFTKRPAQIGPPWRKRMTPPNKTLRRDFQRLLDLPFAHLIGAHGAPLQNTAREDLAATVAATYP